MASALVGKNGGVIDITQYNVGGWERISQEQYEHMHQEGLILRLSGDPRFWLIDGELQEIQA